ncbi:glutathione S-transferase [Nematostella vectensis]|nr:glutathione S-transferase [Nematostella vectensis]
MAANPEFRLFYWPRMSGRGEFVRLLFHETQTVYEDVFADKTFEEAAKMGYGRGKKHFAFPAIEHGDISISQTPVICRYLGKKLDGGRLYPKTEEDRLQAEVLMAGVVDVVEDGCRAWHAIDYNASYDAQKEETQPFIEYYKSKRLPKWLAFFENALKENYEKNGELVFVGKQICWVDFCIFHFIDGNMFECPEVFEKENTEHLEKFHKAIRERPNIKKWYFSEKRPKFTHTGPIF